ncbi:unnamed protein product [Ceutorhynchus assimilis]|uniref:THAP-type domain-containing protein n=1 Tax=Ceutorhynchus assimilis TaxID=467358 RepID=A0A9N9MK85_9CUCU|nr:unnamed protein product [Ceutorhynchus assimilis]
MPAICCISTCMKSGTSKHCFLNPAKDKQRFERWIILCGNQRLVTETTPEQVYKSYRVCSLHFCEKDVGSNGKLKPTVVPSLSLPAPLKIVPLDVETPSTSRPTQLMIDNEVASTSSHGEITFSPKEPENVLSKTNTKICSTPRKQKTEYRCIE